MLFFSLHYVGPKQLSICYPPGYFFKTFLSHIRIGIPWSQCPKLLPVVLSQNKAVAVLYQKAVVVDLALQQARLTALPLPLKKTRSRTRKRARLQQYKTNGHRTRWNTMWICGGQIILYQGWKACSQGKRGPKSPLKDVRAQKLPTYRFF